MDAFIDLILNKLSTFNWEGPAMFTIIFLAFLAIFRKWSILLITLLTIVLGWGAEDLMIMTIETQHEIISLPFIIYCVGGGIALILFIISVLKIMVK